MTRALTQVDCDAITGYIDNCMKFDRLVVELLAVRKPLMETGTSVRKHLLDTVGEQKLHIDGRVVWAKIGRWDEVRDDGISITCRRSIEIHDVIDSNVLVEEGSSGDAECAKSM